VRDYVRARLAELFGDDHPLYLGAWRADSGWYCLDVTRLFPGPDPNAAIGFGHDQVQQCIVRLCDGQKLWLGRPSNGPSATTAPLPTALLAPVRAGAMQRRAEG
jgi:hypothetical protein